MCDCVYLEVHVCVSDGVFVGECFCVINGLEMVRDGAVMLDNIE